MSNHKPSMLIFGAPAAFRPRSMPAGMAGASRALVDDVGTVASQVSVETAAANLRTVMAQVEELLMSGQESAGKLGVAYVDVNLVICADGSVGLLGTAAGTNTKATLTMRLAPRVGSKPAGQESAEPTSCAVDDEGVVLANHGQPSSAGRCAGSQAVAVPDAAGGSGHAAMVSRSASGSAPVLS
jgi:hypothetical protein